VMYRPRNQPVIILRVTRRCFRIVIELSQYGHRLSLLVLLVLVALHGECFAGPSLPIGKYCSMIPLQNI
jgi:hypothetical protein